MPNVVQIGPIVLPTSLIFMLVAMAAATFIGKRVGRRADGDIELAKLTLSSLQGINVNLAQFEGKPTVVNIWARWCPPCVREMPVLHEAQARNPAMNFVFINQGESAERVGGWLTGRNLPLRNVLLDIRGQALEAFNQRGLPTTLFFDAKGRLISTRTGELSAATLAEKLESIH